MVKWTGSCAVHPARTRVDYEVDAGQAGQSAEVRNTSCTDSLESTLAGPELEPDARASSPDGCCRSQQPPSSPDPLLQGRKNSRWLRGASERYVLNRSSGSCGASLNRRSANHGATAAQAWKLVSEQRRSKLFVRASGDAGASARKLPVSPSRPRNSTDAPPALDRRTSSIVFFEGKDVKYETSGLLLPFDVRFRAWTWIVRGLEAYVCIERPFVAAFCSWADRVPAWAIASDVVMVLLLTFHVLVMANTAFVAEYGALQTNRRQVRQHYLLGWGLVDVFSAVPLQMAAFASGNASMATSVYAYLRLSTLCVTFHWLERKAKYQPLQSAQSSRQLKQTHRMVKLLGGCLLIGHWLACIWWGLQRLQSETKEDAAALVEEEGLLSAYAVALHRSMLSLFGEDQEPTTAVERFLDVAVLLLGAGFTATIFANFADLIAMWHKQESRHEEQLETIETTMSMLKVPLELRSRVLHYFDYVWTRHRNFSGYNFLQTLPQTLRVEVSSFVHAKLIKQVPAFMECADEFVSQLSCKMRPSVYLPGSTIFHAGTTGKQMFFIIKGTVAIHTPDGALLNMLNRGDFFGEIALLAQTRRMASARALSWCDLMELDKTMLDEVFFSFPDECERFKEVAKERVNTVLNAAETMRTSLSSAKGLRASKDVAKVHSATANISSGTPRGPGDSSGDSCSPESQDLHSAPESSSRNKHHGLAAQPISLLTLTNLKQAARRLHIVYDQRENDEGANRADARLSSASYASVDSQDCRGGRRALRRNFASALTNKRASQTNPRGITGVLLEKMQRIESTLATAANGVRSGEDRQHQQQDILDQFAEQLRRIEHAVCRKDAHSSSKSKAPDGTIK